MFEKEPGGHLEAEAFRAPRTTQKTEEIQPGDARSEIDDRELPREEGASLGVASYLLWKDSEEPRTPRMKEVEAIAEGFDAELLIDPSHSVTKSALIDYGDSEVRNQIALGGKGVEAELITVALHEIGHQVLKRKNWEPKDTTTREEAAWDIAKELAAEHGLPLQSNVKRRSLQTYKYGDLLKATRGSKARRRRSEVMENYPVWKLVASKRSRGARTEKGVGLGVNSRQRLKKRVKKQSRKYERRQGKHESSNW